MQSIMETFKVCCFAAGRESGLLSLSDRRIDETKTCESEDEVDKYLGDVCLNV